MAIKVPILSEWNPKGIKRAMEDFKKLETTSEKVSFGMKKALVPATAALAGLTAAAGASLKAAVDDAAQQDELARQITAVTGATEEQIAANEAYIATMELATATSDAQLRPALGNLVRATRDVSEAQELLGIALDISAATGKDLNTVSEALAKAYQGETSSLKRLDPSLTAVIKSGAEFEEIGQALADTFGGAAAEAADTSAGRFQRMQIQIDNAQEAIGYALLPILEKLIPVLESVATFIGDNTELIVALGIAIGTVAAIVIAYNTALKLYAVAQGIATAATAVFNAVMAANPVAIVILAIAGLVTLLIALEKKFGVVTKLIEAGKIIFDKLSDAVMWLGDKFVSFINTLIDVANKIPFVEIEKVNNIFKDQAESVEVATAAVDMMKRPLNTIRDAMADARYETALANLEYETAQAMMDELHPTIDDVDAAIARTNEEMEKHHALQKLLSDMNTDLINEFDLLFGRFDNTEAVRNFGDAIAKVAEQTEEFGEQSRQAQEANEDVYRALGDVIEQLDNVPRTTQLELIALLDQGEYDKVLEQVNILSQLANTALTTLTAAEIKAAAGMVGGGTYLPASTIPTPSSSRVIGANGPSGTSSITVNMPAGSDGQDVVRALQQYARTSGTIPIPTTTAVRS